MTEEDASEEQASLPSVSSWGTFAFLRALCVLCGSSFVSWIVTAKAFNRKGREEMRKDRKEMLGYREGCSDTGRDHVAPKSVSAHSHRWLAILFRSV